jgi:hypothetical protein
MYLGMQKTSKMETSEQDVSFCSLKVEWLLTKRKGDQTAGLTRMGDAV